MKLSEVILDIAFIEQNTEYKTCNICGKNLKTTALYNQIKDVYEVHYTIKCSCHYALASEF